MAFHQECSDLLFKHSQYHTAVRLTTIIIPIIKMEKVWYKDWELDLCPQSCGLCQHSGIDSISHGIKES